MAAMLLAFGGSMMDANKANVYTYSVAYAAGAFVAALNSLVRDDEPEEHEKKSTSLGMHASSRNHGPVAVAVYRKREWK